MKASLFLIFLSLFTASLTAQEKTTISGSVYDNSTKEEIEQASVRILNAKDSSYVNGVVTDEAGKFRIQLNRGQYIVHVTYLGYASAFVNVNANKESVALGKINLKDDGILLSEAVITAKAIEIQVKGDTVEYNADSYKVQESAVVEDLLKKMPGVEIDADGKITINGKEIKKILVDGKEFFSDDPKVASKNLPASMINKLQVLDRKSDMSLMTGFDDGNEETVINLTVKPGMKEGMFGNAYAGYGNKDRYEVNGMASYMRNNNQFTVLGGSNNTNNAGFSDFASSSFGGNRPPRGLNFGNKNGLMTSSNGGFNFATETTPTFKWGGDIRYGNTDNDVQSNSYTQNLLTDSISKERVDQFENKTSWGRNKSDNLGLNLRFEWDVDSLTKVIFTPNIQYNKNKNWQNSDYLTTLANPNDSINWGNSEYYMDGSGIKLNGNLDISRQLGKKGRVLSVGLSGGLNDSDSKGINFSETYYKDTNKKDELLDQIINQDETGYNWRGFVSYVEPIGKNNFLQFTYNYRKNHSESDKKTYKNDGVMTIDTTYTKLLKNDFTNQEISLNFKAVREKYNYTVGLGIQPSSSKSITSRVDTANLVKTNVVNFSPTAQFNYIWDRSSNLRIDYNGTTNQPTTTQLSDVPDVTNATNVVIGNPNLKPSFENRLSIRFRKFNAEKGSAIMLFSRFTYTMDDIVNVSTVNQSGDRVTTYDNVSGNMSGNARFIINTPLRNKKFSINSMSFASYNRIKGVTNSMENISNTLRLQESLGLEYRSDIFDAGLRTNFTYNNIKNTSRDGQEDFSYGGNFNTTVYLPYNFTLESDINYANSSGYSSGFDQAEWLWNASLSKQIFKAKNGTIRFKIYDILQDKKNITRSSTAEYIRDVSTNTLTSYFMVHFIYKFQLFKGGVKQGDMEEGMGRGNRGGYGGGRHGRM